MKYYEIELLLKGRKEKILIKAASRKEALYLANIKKGGVVLRANEATPPLEERLAEIKNKILLFSKSKKIKLDNQIAAIRQMAVMVNAGISIRNAIQEIALATTDKNLKNILLRAADDINAGLSLSNSLGNFRYELGNLTLTMIELGEQTGNMSEALFTLANILENIRENISKFKKATRYPITVISAMIIAFVILITFVVPKFEAIFQRFKAELPLPTRILIGLEHLFINYGLYVLVGLVAAIVTIIYLYRNNPNFKYAIDKYLLRLYLIKDILFFSTLSRFTLIFTELIHAGIPVADALDSAVSMVDNAFLRERLNTVKGLVQKGVSLTEAFKETGLFENMIIQMIAAGETSGQLDDMLKKVSEYYNMRFQYILDNMQALLEPILLTVLAGMVLLLALGIFLPMWDLAGAVKGRR